MAGGIAQGVTDAGQQVPLKAETDGRLRTSTGAGSASGGTVSDPLLTVLIAELRATRRAICAGTNVLFAEPIPEDYYRGQ